jgi:hypothetical protein
MYNVLEKVRAGEALSQAEQDIYSKGLISVLRKIHDDLDAATFAAYGWDGLLAAEEILRRLVDLNTTRTAEEKRGVVRWLRPEYQQPTIPVQSGLDLGEEQEVAITASASKIPWPSGLCEQVQAVRQVLLSLQMASPELVSRRFSRSKTARVEEILQTLSTLGQIRHVDGKYLV